MAEIANLQKSSGRDLGITQTVPRPACRYSIAAAKSGFAIFPDSSKDLGQRIDDRLLLAKMEDLG